MKVIYSKKLFNGANTEDASAVATFLAKQMSKDDPYYDSIKTKITEDINQLSNEAAKGGSRIISMSVPEYLSIDRQNNLVPVYVPVSNGSITDRLLLVVKNDSNINSIEALNGKKIITNAKWNDDLSLQVIWFRYLLQQNNIKNIDDYVKYFNKDGNESLLIMDVFFGNSDAAVVFESEFKAVKELNPQVGTNLRILETSKPLLKSISCFTKDLSKNPSSQIIREKVTTLANSTSGRQELRLLKIEKLIAFKEEYLSNTKELFNSYTVLMKSIGKTKIYKGTKFVR